MEQFILAICDLSKLQIRQKQFPVVGLLGIGKIHAQSEWQDVLCLCLQAVKRTHSQTGNTNHSNFCADVYYRKYLYFFNHTQNYQRSCRCRCCCCTAVSSRILDKMKVIFNPNHIDRIFEAQNQSVFDGERDVEILILIKTKSCSDFYYGAEMKKNTLRKRKTTYRSIYK